MNQQRVLLVLDAIEDAGIEVFIEGGWGVDALVGDVTREHRDLDLVVEVEDLPRTKDLLESIGFRHDVLRKPGLPAQLIMVSSTLDEVDVHPVLRDGHGNGWQLLSRAGAWGLYSSDGLGGVGVIGGRTVACTTPELQVRHRLGYPLRDEDAHDLRLIREKFGVGIHPSCDDRAILFELARLEGGADV